MIGQAGLSASSHKCSRDIILIILINLFFWTGLADLAGELLFSRSGWNLGSINPGETRTIDIKIRNTGFETANLDIKSSCRCLLIEPAFLAIPTREDGVLKLTYTGQDSSGKIEEELIILSGTPEPSRLIFPVTGTIAKKDEAVPESFSRENEPGGEVEEEYSAGIREVEAEYYYDPYCGACKIFLGKTLPKLQKDFNVKFKIKYFNILAPEGYEALQERLGQLNVPYYSTPVFMVGDNVFQGREIDDQLDLLLRDGVRYTRLEEYRGKVKIDPGEYFLLAPVFLAGLLDGVNPCAFSTLIFLLAAMTLAGKRKKEVLFIGLFYTLSVFVSYFLFGAGMFTVLKKAQSFPVISEIIKYLLVVVLFLFSLLSVIDYIRIRKGEPGKIILQLPKRMKRAVHSSIREGLRSGAIIISAVVMGFLVSLFELGCTGQIYLPTIAYMVQRGSKVKGFTSLFIYNLGFIIPLAGVFFLSYKGLGSERLGSYFKRHLGSVKLATAALFLGLGVLTLLIP